ncbi:MAG: hypothetical protein KTR30_19695, partial [Saprospiraceae bacterium]|nr:hypothetical protein [Saprospiraceae bacterium]
LYDERVRVLHTVFDIPVYPSMEEIEIYENKKYFSYWAKARQIPHPATEVFYFEKEAIESLEHTSFPVVAKTSIGASGRGVRILKTKEDAQDYIRSTFSGEGANRSVGPKWRKKGFVGRVIKKLLNPTAFKAKLQQYKNARNDVQKDFVIFQEYIPHDYEWRCVRIGDSFFAHKKLMDGEKASGSLLKGYENPPLELMDFVKEVTDAYGFYSQAVDVFEPRPGQYLINEMQCIFGQSDPYQMKVDGIIGRYVYHSDQWVFEAGDFNGLESYLLRMDHFIELLTAKVPVA